MVKGFPEELISKNGIKNKYRFGGGDGVRDVSGISKSTEVYK